MSGGGDSPAVARLRLRHALRSARESCELTQEQVAATLEWSLSKVIRIENGSVRMTITDVRALLQLYGVDDRSTVSEMEAFARASRQRSWWAEFGETIPPKFRTFIGLEDGASELYFFQSLVIPGLLQTEPYSRAVLTAVQNSWSSAQVREDHITIRMRRQEHVLRRADPPQVHVVLDEATLRRVNGGVHIQREQLLHLVALGAQPNIHLQVLPLIAGIYTMDASFVLMSFPLGTDADVVYLETNNPLAQVVDRAQVLDREEGAVPYRETFARLASAALPEPDSLSFIAKVAGELR